MLNSVFKKSFNSARCKTLLRLAISRIKLLRNKRDLQLKQMKLELAKLLQSNQEPSAHIRVEHIYREQNIMAAYEVIELLCELIAARLPIIESQKSGSVQTAASKLAFILSIKGHQSQTLSLITFCSFAFRQCPVDLREAISSIIFAAPQCSDIPELQQIRSIFSAKYGEKFTAIAADLRPDCGVNRVVIQKLSVKGPSGEIKLKLMKDIAAEHSVDWDPTALESQRLMPPEDLLEAPSQFFGGSQMHLQKSFDEPSISEQISLQNEGNVDEKQFIPFVRPIGAGSQSTSSIATSHWQRSSSDHASHVLSATPSYKYDEGVDVQPVFDRRESLRGEAAAAHFSHGLSATPQYKYGEGKDARPEFDRRNSLKGMAATALAAAESAERAAAAARAAVELVSEHFERDTSGSSSDSESDNNGDEVSQLQARFENIRFKSGKDPLDDSESDNNGNGVLQLQARFEHSPLKPGRDPLDDSLTYRSPLFDEPEGAGLYRKQASGRNLTSCDGPIAGHSGCHSIFGKGRCSDDSESASHSTSRLDLKPGRDPPDDSLIYRTPLFDEPAEGKRFYRDQTSGKNSATYDGPIAGQSVSNLRFGKGGYDDYSEADSHSTSGRDPLDDSLTYKTPLFDEPAEGKRFYTKQTLGRYISGFDGSIAGHSVSHSIFGKGGHNNDSESVSHSTPRLDRHGDDQASREQLHGRNFQHNNISSFRTRSFETAGATPSFDTFGWDNKPADEAAQSTTARPPERPPPKLPGPQSPTLTKNTSFVHPKLPDYDSLTAHFKALKAVKCKK